MAKHQNQGETGGFSQRQQRVNELLRRALGEIFSKGTIYELDSFGGTITVGEVEASPDLRVAKIFVSKLGGGDASEIVKTLNDKKGVIRKEVNQLVKLKYSPELRFLYDSRFDYFAKASELLDKLPPKGES